MSGFGVHMFIFLPSWCKLLIKHQAKKQAFWLRVMNDLAFAMKMVALCAVLMACQDDAGKFESKNLDATVGDLAGCYGIIQGEPAQIKINQTADGFSMQMREPKDSQSLWDHAEPLTLLDINQGWGYFKVNTLDLGKSDAQHIIARPDGMMALMQVKVSTQNTNPRLDSAYVMHIVQGSNTVYQMPCDD